MRVSDDVMGKRQEAPCLCLRAATEAGRWDAPKQSIDLFSTVLRQAHRLFDEGVYLRGGMCLSVVINDPRAAKIVFAFRFEDVVGDLFLHLGEEGEVLTEIVVGKFLQQGSSFVLASPVGGFCLKVEGILRAFAASPSSSLNKPLTA